MYYNTRYETRTENTKKQKNQVSFLVKNKNNLVTLFESKQIGKLGSVGPSDTVDSKVLIVGIGNAILFGATTDVLSVFFCSEVKVVGANLSASGCVN